MTLTEAIEHQKKHGFILSENSEPQGESLGVKLNINPKRGTNKTEAEFERILRSQYPDSPIWFESFKLRLADGCWYTPDFFRFLGGVAAVFYEVKGGHIWDDAKVKFKVAKAQYPEFDFELWQKKAGTWTRLL